MQGLYISMETGKMIWIVVLNVSRQLDFAKFLELGEVIVSE